ncbi:MAG: hypothetical protein Kilf2KO_08920 [Rhodospirillales bacterium]
MKRLYAALGLSRAPPARVTRWTETAARAWMPLLLFFGAALYLPILDARPLRFEEGRRAVQALEIYFGGSWWYLEVLGEPYVNKPPLLPWLIALVGSFRGGIDEVAVRLPAVLSVLLGAVTAGALARLLLPERGAIAALCAGVAFYSCAFVMTKARLGETDTLVTAFCGLAVLIWVRARLKGEVGWLAWAGVSLCLAAAAFTKGPIPLLFPALPLLALPLLQRRWREALAALAALLASLLPLGWWAYDNLAATDAAHWTQEMRVAGRDLPPGYWLSLLHLNQVPVGIAYTLPWFLPALWVIVAARCDWLRQSWPVLALALYALPVSLFVLIWGEARPRYAMPAVWPLVVLAGLWVARYWLRSLVPALLLLGGIITPVIFQIVTLGFVEGKTDYQRAFLARAEALSSATAPLPPGPLLLLDSAGEPDFDSLAYAGRPLTRLPVAALACPSQGRFLLVTEYDRASLADLPVWRLEAEIAGGWMALYARDESVCPLGR